MGIIQSSVNQSLTGTAFLLGQMRGVKSQEKTAKQTKEYYDYVRKIENKAFRPLTPEEEKEMYGVTDEKLKSYEKAFPSDKDDSMKGFEAEEKAKRSIGYKTAMLKESKERQQRMKEAIKNRKLDFTEFGGEGIN